MSANPRGVMIAAAVLQSGKPARSAAKLSGLSVGTIYRIRSSLVASGAYRAPEPKPREPLQRDLAPVAQRLSAAILRCLRVEMAEPALTGFSLPPILRLTPTESDILALLVRRAGRPVSTESFATVVWSNKDVETANNLAVLIVRIRKKLQPYGIRVTTRVGVGYVLSCEDRDKILAINNDEIVALPPLPCMARRA